MSKSSKCDDQSSLRSLKGESNQEEITPNESEGNSSEKSKNRWTEEDSVCLLFFVNKFGRKWKLIADNYKSYLKNKNEQFLHNKYNHLKRNKSLFKKLEKEAELLKDVEILKNNENYSELPCKSDYVYEKWSEDESLYLVYGVLKYPTDREALFNYYRTHVNQYRSRCALRDKYYRIRQNPNRLLDLEEKAKLLNEKEKFESIRFDKVINRMNSS